MQLLRRINNVQTEQQLINFTTIQSCDRPVTQAIVANVRPA